MKIRQANYLDISKLAELFDLYRQFYGQQSNLTEASRYLLNRMEHGQSIVFLVEDPKTGNFLGFTQLYPVFSSISMQRSYILNDLYVRSENRKQGIAKLLLDEAKSFTKHFQGKGLELSTASLNKDARSLYEKQGFVQETEFLTYFWKST
ncbi:GNAT family N-acetyltransferase [Leptospira biflexa]|uniref:Putative acetyltransferase n=1 Tax=Leptospira biflexa serovar Patoc (strain Patoc 1 / ATCC 23582 / Paris) TaxID=456481 RepID=B0SIY1_LEPBP|nr:GNAT family N-acetyltransferase [Leptospira biflexa]ABZ92901.1 Acetyltransferase [Leptospira biflexa serovar Patoc strain 'Patoc 1 (Ames)']ABZ96509.1 Putative acetyltransferase [Leptospira biflexa serovar Patoc strain 'Patoc 1 (Paris)']TGM37829.1 GNAT family N-acetyltransferase [Leptospira biflexa]TGM41162.1 GNAT family N-acetyltransferase [Leptospira biflexa]TGM47364.1 GNAT family N-acetyltransferase [Leptospira biflexa]